MKAYKVYDKENYEGHQELRLVWKMITGELERTTRVHGKFNSIHEGYAVVLEELDEVWEAIKSKDADEARIEMVQVAAMAIRFILDASWVGGGNDE